MLPYRPAVPVSQAVLLRHLESPLAYRVAVVLYAAALACGLKRFVVWDQIQQLEGAGWWQVFSSLHPHALRWVVMQPAQAFGLGGWDQHAAFTAWCFVLVLMTTELLARAAACSSRAALQALRVWIFLPLAIATLGMNGRLIPAFAGLALIICLHAELATGGRRHWAWHIIGEALGLLLLSVSSGTAAVGAVACLVAWAMRVRWWWTALGAVLVGGLSLAMLGKVARFFQGEPLRILDHGAGALLAAQGQWVAGVGCVAIAAGAFLAAWRCPWPRPAGWCFRVPVAAALVFGLLGWSTLAVGLPVVIALLAMAMASAESLDARSAA
jgi:hypothetical protein